MEFSVKLLYLPNIKKIETIVQKTNNAISFAQGALRVGDVPQKAREYIASLLQTDQADYYGPAGGINSLKESIAAFFKPENNLIEARNILISHGSIGAFSVLCAKLLRAGDHVLLPVPTYPVYQNVIKSFDVESIFSYAYIFKNGTWQFDLSILEASITPKTKMLIISNPSNPLGLLLTKEILESLIALAEKHAFLLVIDEAYDAFIFQHKWQSSIEYVLHSKQLVRLGSFSKNASMSGWRIGYLMADQALVNSLIPTQDALFCCPSMIGQMLAEFMIQNTELMKPSQQLVLQARDKVVSFFNQYKESHGIEFQSPEGGFYLFLRWPNHNADVWVFDLLKKKQVGLVPGSDFSDQHHQWARLCFARSPEKIDEGLRRFAEYFKEQKVLALTEVSPKCIQV